MASQRVLILTIGGPLADIIWADICRWGDARCSVVSDEWSPDDWPSQTKTEIDAFVAKLAESAYLPPVLYRSEHMDLWLMGGDFVAAFGKCHADRIRELLTSKYEVIATWGNSLETIHAHKNAPAETKWLYSRINEAIGAWEGFTENRLLLLVRIVLGGLWENEDVTDAVRKIPSWWVGSNQMDGKPVVRD